MAPELAAERRSRRELGRPIDELFAEWDPVPHRGRVDRPGPPGHHPRRPRRGGQGAVPRRRRGHQGRPRQRRPALPARRDAVPRPRAGAARRGAPRRGSIEELDYRLEAAQPAAVRRRLPRPPVHPRARRGRRAVDGAGCSPPSWPTACASTSCRPGARTSATSPARRSTASCSAASTGCTRSTATRTRATTSSSPAAG